MKATANEIFERRQTKDSDSLVMEFERLYTEGSECHQRDTQSASNICDIEKGRKQISHERAAHIARKLGVPETALIQLAILNILRAANLHFAVETRAF
jgi:transcriptional regulator with XRE-family HTH domain